MTRIVIIDPQFAEHADIERAAAGPEPVFDILRPGEDEVSTEAFKGVDAVLNCRSRHLLPARLVEAMDGVRVIVQAGVGYNHIDLDACGRRGIPVCNTPDYGTREVADHAMALILGLVRGVIAYNNRLMWRDDSWSTLGLPLRPVRRIARQVLGIVGLGRIGTALALRARAFEFDIVFYDPHLPPGYELALGLRRAKSLHSLLAESDIVSLHCPLTPETKRLINNSTLAAMKPGAILVNTARGGVTDLDAIERALRSDRLCAAGLDVLPTEPLDRAHPLIAAWARGEAWLEGRLILTPHAAFYSPESLADMRRIAMETIMQFLREGIPRSCVNLKELAYHGKLPKSGCWPVRL